MSPFASLAVGKLYKPGQTSWPVCVDYNYTTNGHELRLFWNQMAKQEIMEVKKGRAEFALFIDQRVMWLCFKFGTMPWSDQPFNIQLVPQDIRALPQELEANQRASLVILLVDADTGILKAIRSLTFSPAFSVALHKAISEQCREPVPSWLLNTQEYTAFINSTYDKYPYPDDMVRKAVARCRGGE